MVLFSNTNVVRARHLERHQLRSEEAEKTFTKGPAAASQRLCLRDKTKEERKIMPCGIVNAPHNYNNFNEVCLILTFDISDKAEYCQLRMHDAETTQVVANPLDRFRYFP